MAKDLSLFHLRFVKKTHSSIDVSINELGLPNKVYNALKRFRINTVNELISYSPYQLKTNVFNLGEKSLSIIIDALEKMGIYTEEISD